MKLAYSIMLFLLSNICWANQVFNVKDGDRVSVVFSQYELNRLVIKGAKITDVRGAAGFIEVTPDKKAGEIYVKTLLKKPNYSFFVSANNGSTYTIVVNHSDVPAQTISLIPKSKLVKNKKINVKLFDALPLRNKVGKIGMAMAKDEDHEAFDVENIEDEIEIKLWKEVKINLIKQYIGNDLKGDVFSIKNRSKDEIRLHESEFLNFGENVIAVSIEKHELKPGEKTKLFIVKGMNK